MEATSFGPIREKTRNKYRGMRYGRLTILDVTRRDGKNTHHYFVAARCDCGVEKEVRLSGLQAGSTLSCGCYAEEARRAANIGNTRARHAEGMNAQRSVFMDYKRHAKSRGLFFDLNFEQLVKIASQPCFYCAAPPANISAPKNAYGSFIYNGIDRVDNDLGYSVENCVPCCRPCNSAKNSITKEMVWKLFHRLFPLQRSLS